MPQYSTTMSRQEGVARDTIAFHIEKPAAFRHQPGQAIDVVLSRAGAGDAQELRHAFSIVSAPGEPQIVFATRMRASEFKRALGALRPGSRLTISGPFGSMTLHPDGQRPAALIAGGIGITPFMSMLRWARSERTARSFLLLYSNRSPQDSAFLDELRQLEHSLPAFRPMATMTDIGSSTAWDGPTGMIDAAMLRKAVGSRQSPIYYVAGPPSMVTAMRGVLESLGVVSDDVRSEEFYGY